MAMGQRRAVGDQFAAGPLTRSWPCLLGPQTGVLKTFREGCFSRKRQVKGNFEDFERHQYFILEPMQSAWCSRELMRDISLLSWTDPARAGFEVSLCPRHCAEEEWWAMHV